MDIISTLALSLNQTHTKLMTKTKITERRARQGSTTLYKEGIGVKRIAKSLQGKGAWSASTVSMVRPLVERTGPSR